MLKWMGGEIFPLFVPVPLSTSSLSRRLGPRYLNRPQIPVSANKILLTWHVGKSLFKLIFFSVSHPFDLVVFVHTTGCSTFLSVCTWALFSHLRGNRIYFMLRATRGPVEKQERDGQHRNQIPLDPLAYENIKSSAFCLHRRQHCAASPEQPSPDSRDFNHSAELVTLVSTTTSSRQPPTTVMLIYWCTLTLTLQSSEPITGRAIKVAHDMKPEHDR